VREAHRTSGSLGKAWAAIHDQEAIPAARRLYLTATPRIWEVREPLEVREGARPALREEMAASMDEVSRGRVAPRWGEAVHGVGRSWGGFPLEGPGMGRLA
jgi:predicted helicase